MEMYSHLLLCKSCKPVVDVKPQDCEILRFFLSDMLITFDLENRILLKARENHFELF